MKSIQLFPNVCKRIGWCLFIPAYVIYLLVLLDVFPSNIQLEGPCFILLEDNVFNFASFFHIGKTDWVDEILMILIAVSQYLILFAREKDEDEYIGALRLNAIAWSLKWNTILFVLVTLFVFGFFYVSFLGAYVFSFFLLAIVRYYVSLYKMRRAGHEE